MKVLGVPVGHKEFIKAQLRMKSVEQKVVGEEASLEFLRGHTFQLLVENCVSRAHCRVRCGT